MYKAQHTQAAQRTQALRACVVARCNVSVTLHKCDFFKHAKSFYKIACKLQKVCYNTYMQANNNTAKNSKQAKQNACNTAKTVYNASISATHYSALT